MNSNSEKVFTPTISIVVIVYNGERTLAKCLDSLLALDFPKEQIEIIVVDNASYDQTKDIILKYPVIYLFEPHRGRGWARNCGSRYASGKFVAFTDSDCIASPDWLTNLMKGFDGAENVAICGGKITAYRQETKFEQYVEETGLLSQEKGIKGENIEDLPRVVTANAMFRKSVLEEVDYFDEQLVTSEDTEISWRIVFLGYELKYVSEAVIHHQHVATLGHFIRHHFEFGKAAAVLNKKYQRAQLGISGPPSMSSAIFLILRALAALVRKIFMRLILRIGKRKPVFLFFDTILETSFNIGGFCSLMETTFLQEKKVFVSKVPLDSFYKTLTIRRDDIQWSLHPRTFWFLSDGQVRLGIYRKYLQIYKFNATATRLWQSLIKTKDFSKAVDDLKCCYGLLSDTLERDSQDFMEALENEKIIVRNVSGAVSQMAA